MRAFPYLSGRCVNYQARRRWEAFLAITNPEILAPGARSELAAFTHAELDRIERRLDRLSRALDTAWGIPGTRFRLGADAILGLIPGIGDLLGIGLAGYFVLEAKRLGAPQSLINRMTMNIGIDAALGAVPLLGDIADVFFKANRRNYALLREHISDLRSRSAKVINPARL